MKKKSFFLILIALLLQFICSALSAQQKKGWKECNDLLNFLHKNNYQAQENPIINNNSADFPFNIKLTFYPDNASDSLNTDQNHDEINNLVLLFAIEEIQENYPFLLKMLKSIENYSLTGTITLLFTYGDERGFFNRNLISGSESFAEEIEDTGNTAVICLHFGAKLNSITPGSAGDISPAWLISLIANSFYENSIFYHIKGNLLTSLHRLNILKNDKTAAIFMSRGIPSCGLDLISPSQSEDFSKKLANFTGSLAYNFNPEETIEWDRHSRPFLLFNYPFMVSEKFTIILFIIISAAALFLICEFSFIKVWRKNSYSRHVVRKWYLIPLCILITSIAFYIGQYFAYGMQKLINLDIISCYGIKIFFAFLFISFAYFLIFKLRGTHSTSVFSFLITITGIINLFLFTIFDLSLFYAFALEYAIILITQKLKRTVSLIILFFELAIPFIPYMVQLLNYSTAKSLSNILMASGWMNIAFAFAFLPFEFVWFRILARLNTIWQKFDQKKKISIKQNSLAIGGAFVIFGITLIIITALIPDEYKIKSRNLITIEEENAQDQIEIFYYDENFLGDTIRTVTVKLFNTAENVEISIKGTVANPILYTDEKYYYSINDKKAIFQIPAYSPQIMSFNYIADESQDIEIEVSELLPKDEKKLLKICKKLSIPAKTENKAATNEI